MTTAAPANTTVAGIAVSLVLLLGVTTQAADAAPTPPQARSAAATHTRRTKAHHRAAHHRRRVVVRINAGGRGGDPGNDYPSVWRYAGQDSLLDNWRELNRECTSFAAWALASRNGFPMPFHDNAINWGPRAQALGYIVDRVPAPGSVAWSNKPPLGHVAYVESVNGSAVYVEEYNRFGNGTYDSRTVPATAFTGYIHFKDITVPGAPSSSTTAPIQGSSPTLQGGSSSPIQGSSPVLQGGPSPGSGGTAAPPATYTETTGGVTHTWTNYSNAGGYEGSAIPSNATIEVACKVGGFAVADGNTWWYRIVSSPWNGAYYASADAFYNDAQTSGSLHGTPFMDAAVPNC